MGKSKFWKKFHKKSDEISIFWSEVIVKYTRTWTFIFVYTLSMILWIVLHVKGILHIDSEDFMKWNLFLSWFAGIQAPLVLMSTERQALKDRKKVDEGINLDKATLQFSKLNLEKMKLLQEQIEMLEVIVDELIKEKADEEDGKKNK